MDFLNNTAQQAPAVSAQTTGIVIMIEPVRFDYNQQTAQSNTFQHQEQFDTSIAQDNALEEFRNLVSALRTAGVEVIVYRDILAPSAPDSIFPNNWFSTHQNGSLVIYPMATPNRRYERRNDILDELRNRFGYAAPFDMTGYEEQNVYLEGTGSLVLDRKNNIAYAAISLRTQMPALQEYALHMGYRIVAFHTQHPSGTPVYHTNVLMSVGERIAVVCFAVIASEAERTAVREALESTHHQIITLSIEQLNHFAGNMLNLKNNKSQNIWVMSTNAWQSLDANQQQQLEADGIVVHSPLTTIETLGGGSARCMIAEVFPPSVRPPIS